MWVQIYFFSSHRDRPGTCPQLHKVYRQHSIQKAFTGTNVSSVSPIEYKCIILSDNSRYCFIHTGTVPDRARSYIKCIVSIRFRKPSQAQTSRQFRPSSNKCIILSDNSRYCFIHTGTVPDRARSFIKCIVCIRFRTPSQAQTSRQFRPSSTSALFYLTTRVTASFIRCRRFSDLP